jgi:hypothetical protein
MSAPAERSSFRECSTSFLREPQARARGAARASRLILAAILVLLAGCFVFCHGCHLGDHDDELLIWLADRDR